MKTKIFIEPHKVFIVLSSIALMFLLIYLWLLFFDSGFNASTKEGVTRLFNLNAEISIPTWFSQSILLISAALLFLVSSATSTHKKHWLGLATIFAYVSIDEGSAIHELTVSPIKRIFGIDSGLLYYSWVVLFGGLFVLLCAVYIKFYLSLPNRTKILFATAAIIFITGAVGLEMIGGSIAAESGESTMVYSVAVAGEEFMEMFGVVVFIYALLLYMKSNKYNFITSSN
jgi:hypothetical protein